MDQIIKNGIAPRLLGGFTGLNPRFNFTKPGWERESPLASAVG
uniref:Uncharacterized protein n=1 Tax=Planktothrix agardhii TaxID=1160 RepID=A0A1J1JGE2_PLAAG|nr:protein of unknown function [Planktothrix agardhii]